jgi:hypothetical protein
MEKDKIQIRYSNPYAAMIVLVLVAIIFIGYYVMMKPYAIIDEKFTNDTSLQERLTTEDLCEGRGYWYDGGCHQLPQRGKDLMARIKRSWLAAPFIFAFSLLVWLFTQANKRDYRTY